MTYSNIILQQKRNPIEGDIKQEIKDDKHLISIYSNCGEWVVIHECQAEGDIIPCRRSGMTERDIIKEGIERLNKW